MATSDAAGGESNLSLSNLKGIEAAYKKETATTPELTLKLPRSAVILGENMFKLKSDDAVPCITYDARKLPEIPLPANVQPDLRRPSNVKLVVFADSDAPVTTDLALTAKHCIYELRQGVVTIYVDHRDHSRDDLASEDAFFAGLSEVGKLYYMKERLAKKIPRVKMTSAPNDSTYYPDLKALAEAGIDNFIQSKMPPVVSANPA